MEFAELLLFSEFPFSQSLLFLSLSLCLPRSPFLLLCLARTLSVSPCAFVLTHLNRLSLVLVLSLVVVEHLSRLCHLLTLVSTVYDFLLLFSVGSSVRWGPILSVCLCWVG